ncbi:hypothetical protein BpHYR1_029636 [Brachionus plicatilis]|uniref:Uncharacterized protein n=1 Tax=Brachionus plicatilis TaxID=10195 RepID=A0A3M7RCR1_BRAPC|nr:hypothetical protein BpHYR1_029636 [Brachionus plicatilis]
MDTIEERKISDGITLHLMIDFKLCLENFHSKLTQKKLALNKSINQDTRKQFIIGNKRIIFCSSLLIFQSKSNYKKTITNKTSKK